MKTSLNFIIKWKPSKPFSHTGNKKYHPQGEGQQHYNALSSAAEELTIALHWQQKYASLESGVCVEESH